MRTVYKYPLPFKPHIYIDMPAGAKVRHVEMQNDVGTLWVEVETDNKTETHEFYLVWTGEELPSVAGEHVGTFQDRDLIWHLYADRSNGL